MTRPMTDNEILVWTQVLIADFAARMHDRPQDTVSVTGEEYQQRLAGYKHDSLVAAIHTAGRMVFDLRMVALEMTGDNDYALFYRQVIGAHGPESEKI